MTFSIPLAMIFSRKLLINLRGRCQGKAYSRLGTPIRSSCIFRASGSSRHSANSSTVIDDAGSVIFHFHEKISSPVRCHCCCRSLRFSYLSGYRTFPTFKPNSSISTPVETDSWNFAIGIADTARISFVGMYGVNPQPRAGYVNKPGDF